MKMQKKQSVAICIAMLLSMILISCTKVDQFAKLDDHTVNESTSKYYYYYQKKKKDISLNTEVINIVSKKKLDGKYRDLGTISWSNAGKAIIESSDGEKKQKGEKLFYGKLRLRKKGTEEEYLKIINNFYSDEDIQNVSPTFIDPQLPQGVLSINNFFYVKLNSQSDISYLYNLANSYGVTVIGQQEYMPLWYTLSILDGSQNSLELANTFYQTGMFEYAHPDFMLDNSLLSCPTDANFNNQWGNNNIGQMGGTSGVDIKACSALNLVRSSGAIIDVAILDDGFDMAHPDLIANLWGPQLSFNCNTKTSPATLVNRSGHGTAVAGILGARENGNGIVGVAPYCRLMLVSHDFAPETSAEIRKRNLEDMAAGIKWSVQNGAEVLNFSWQCGYNDLIVEAIKYATIYGRNGKGCIVVCASGNGNSDVVFPANASLNIITVGSINQCGTRSMYSNCSQSHYVSSGYGVWLEVVAPGSNIFTADIVGPDGHSTSDYGYIHGTSAAAPYVSGVAALILSRNPTLTLNEVRNIIESTTQKVGGYSYGYEPYRNNGTWHPEMGYGLINAYAAVLNTPYPGILLGYEYYANPINP
jgi:subtilisin family serine protease